MPRAPRRAHDPALEARLERLKAVRNRLAIELELAPGVLCPNGTLEGVARANPRECGGAGGDDDPAEVAALRHRRRAARGAQGNGRTYIGGNSSAFPVSSSDLSPSKIGVHPFVIPW